MLSETTGSAVSRRSFCLDVAETTLSVVSRADLATTRLRRHEVSSHAPIPPHAPWDDNICWLTHGSVSTHHESTKSVVSQTESHHSYVETIVSIVSRASRLTHLSSRTPTPNLLAGMFIRTCKRGCPSVSFHWLIEQPNPSTPQSSLTFLEASQHRDEAEPQDKQILVQDILYRKSLHPSRWFGWSARYRIPYLDWPISVQP